MKNTDLKRRIIRISYDHKLSHIGSALTGVDILDEIYDKKEAEDIVILSAGHAGLALYVVLEKYYGLDAEYLFNKHGVHPNKSIEDCIPVSTGSLGHGFPIGIGMALAEPNRTVYVVSSDGELREGSMYEAMRLLESQYIPVELYINNNGYGAYHESSIPDFWYGWANVHVVDTDNRQLPFLKGLDAHYHVMSEEDYQLAMKILG